MDRLTKLLSRTYDPDPRDARIAELERALQAGRDLMAIIHRDGGDYRQTHGDRKAADDAIAIVIDLRAELAAEREQREAAEALLLAICSTMAVNTHNK